MIRVLRSRVRIIALDVYKQVIEVKPIVEKPSKSSEERPSMGILSTLSTWICARTLALLINYRGLTVVLSASLHYFYRSA